MNQRNYDSDWVELNRDLNDIASSAEGLGGALRALCEQQMTVGYIRDDLERLRRYRFADPNDPSRFFTIQYNPTRAMRFGGSGIDRPPPGEVLVNDGCFLCRQNIRWQQSGRELGYELLIEDEPYIAWMNPYPLLSGHTVIASLDHVPQQWKLNGDGRGNRHLISIVSHLASVVSRLPGWFGFYNGTGAGASIPHHFHYQLMPRPVEIPRFPLEIAARRAIGDGPLLSGCYPVDFAHWRGDTAQVLDQALPWVQRYAEATPLAELTANVIATAGDRPGEIDLYFVPRDPSRSRSPHMSGLIGGLEVLGELIFSTDDENLRLERNEIDYATVAEILGSVAVTHNGG